MRYQRGFSLQLIVYAVAAFAILAALYGMYYTIDKRGYARGASEVSAQWSAAIVAQREKEQAQAATAATNLETGNAKAKIVYRTLTQRVEHVVDRPVYRNVCLDTDGLSVANAALNGGESAPALKLDKSLPAAKPAE